MPVKYCVDFCEAFTAAHLAGMRSDKLMVDVGAAYGWEALIARRHGNPVLSFECRHDEYERIARFRDSLSDSYWSVEHGCLSNVSGTGTLYRAHHSSSLTQSAVAGGRERKLADREKNKTEAIPLFRLDSFLRESKAPFGGHWPPVGFLKVDTQGHEPQVLSGALEMIRRDRPIVNYEDVFTAAALKRGGLLNELLGGEPRYTCQTQGADVLCLPDAPKYPLVRREREDVQQSLHCKAGPLRSVNANAKHSNCTWLRAAADGERLSTLAGLPPQSQPPQPQPRPQQPQALRRKQTQRQKTRPLASPASHKDGRTAVCLTGLPRSLYATWPDEVDIPYRGGDTKHMIAAQDLLSHFRWAGPRRRRFADNIMAASFHYNVFDQLSRHGGYDLFVVKPGAVRGTNGKLQQQAGPNPWNGGYDALRPDTVNSQGVPDTMTLIQKGEEMPLPYNRSDPRWSKYVMSARMPAREPDFTQNVLFQLYDQYLCNQFVLNYSALTGTTYRWKMRMRTDLALIHPIPSLASLDLGDRSHPKVRRTSPRYFAGANQDTFGVGEAWVMDVYFDRYRAVYTHPYTATDGWSLEKFLTVYMQEKLNATLHGDDELRGVLVRMRGFARGRDVRAQGGSTSSQASSLLKAASGKEEPEQYAAHQHAMASASYRVAHFP
jgi:FkbM family methyltransferase